MTISSARTPFLLLPTAVLLVALCLVPPTGRLVRAQLSMLVTQPAFLTNFMRDLGVKDVPGGAQVVDNRNDAMKATVARYPDDPMLQIAGALLPGPTGETLPLSTIRVQRFADLSVRFPRETAIYAHLLRYATQGEVGTGRQADEAILTETPQPGAQQNASRFAASAPTYAPEALARYDAAALAGERLDPDNAYFPLMRAVGLFASRRDAEALAEVHRAASATRWEDYCMNEVEANELLRTRAYGEQMELERMAYTAALLYPHFSRLRSVARLVTVKAIQAEQAGQAETGFAYRRNLLRVGALLRVQSRSIIGSLVGIAIEGVAMARPGGAPNETPRADATAGSGLNDAAHADRRREALQAKYAAWLTSIGHADEATWLASEQAASVKASRIIHKGMERSLWLMLVPALLRWWGADLVVLYNAVWLALLSGLAWGLARRSVPERAAVRSLLASLAIGAALVLRPGGPQTFRLLAGIQSVLFNLSGSDTVQNLSPLQRFMASSDALAGLAGALSFALPVLLLAGIGIYCLARRRKFSTELLCKLPTVGLTLACLTLIAYSAMIYQTYQVERAIHTGIQRTMQHEGRYLAEQLGEKWE